MGEVRTFQAALEGISDTLAHIEGATTPQDQSGRVRRVNPGNMSHDERAALVADIQKGDVFALRFKVRAFGTGPNLHDVQLSPEQIKELSDTANEADLMVRHTDDVTQSVGEILGGETRDMSGEHVLVLDQELTDPDAMVRFARRQLRSFSVSIEAADWQQGRDGKVLAVSPVRLIHNAFVSRSAYRPASVINNQAGASPMPDKDQTGAPDYSAQIAALEATVAAQAAELTEAKTKLEARESAAFSAELDRACQAGKIKPTARAQYDQARKAMGFDAAVGLLGGLADGNALPIAPVGDAPTAPKRIDNAAPAVDVKAEVERITGKPYDPTKIKRV